MYIYNGHITKILSRIRNRLEYSVYIQHTYHEELIKNKQSLNIQCTHKTYISQRTNQEKGIV